MADLNFSGASHRPGVSPPQGKSVQLEMILALLRKDTVGRRDGASGWDNAGTQGRRNGYERDGEPAALGPAEQASRTAGSMKGDRPMSSTAARSQRLTALERANEVRSCRAGLKRDLLTHRVLIEEVLLQPPEWLLSANVVSVLLSAPRMGRRRSVLALRHVGVLDLTRPLGSLTVRQRRELAQQVAYPAEIG
jgi:hypothetical protein